MNDKHQSKLKISGILTKRFFVTCLFFMDVHATQRVRHANSEYLNQFDRSQANSARRDWRFFEIQSLPCRGGGVARERLLKLQLRRLQETPLQRYSGSPDHAHLSLPPGAQQQPHPLAATTDGWPRRSPLGGCSILSLSCGGEAQGWSLLRHVVRISPWLEHLRKFQRDGSFHVVGGYVKLPVTSIRVLQSANSTPLRCLRLPICQPELC